MPSTDKALSRALTRELVRPLVDDDTPPVPAIPVNVSAPVISGSISEGSTLTLFRGAWTGVPSPAYTYQWRRGASNISGATNDTYVLQAADVGANITCRVTATNTEGSANATSNSLGPITVSAPVNTVAPTITGTASVGSTLTANVGTWTGSSITYAYQWKRDGVNIAGATNSTYDTVTADYNTTITVVVTATNAGGSVPATSAGKGPITATSPANTVAPAISGTATEGQTLTVSNGTWTGTDTISYTYQWKRGGVNIAGATSNSYVLVTDDVGATITCTVTGTNVAGNASATSAGVGPVAAAPVGGWQISGATVDLDFAGDRYHGATLGDVSVTRASGGFAENVDGTLTWFAANTPRRTNKGLLVEEQRTNIIKDYRFFKDEYPTSWGDMGATWDKYSDIVDPTGASTSVVGVTASSGIAEKQMRYNLGVPTGEGGKTYVFSVYVKPNPGPYHSWVQWTNPFPLRWLRIRMLGVTQAGGSGANVWFDLLNGVKGSAEPGRLTTDHGIEPAGNGWFRCWVKGTYHPNPTYTGIDVAMAEADLDSSNSGGIAGGSVFLWGAQNEEGEFMTSLIPTFGNDVTRAADSVVLPAAVTTAINTDGRFLYVAGPDILRNSGINGRILNTRDGNGNNAGAIFDGNAGSETMRAFSFDASGIWDNFPVDLTPGQSWKLAHSQRFGDPVTYAVNGTATNSTYGGIWPNITTGYVELGNSQYNEHMNGYYSRVAFGPVYKTTSDLATLTSPDVLDIDMNFAANTYSGAALSDLTVTRASGGYAEKADGTLQWFEANTPRVTDKGLLVEGQRTNVLYASRDFESNWSITGGSVTVADVSTTDPTGATAVCKRLTFSAADGSRFNQTFTLTSGKGSLSVYVKAASAADVGKRHTLYAFNSGFKGVVSFTLQSHTTWQRVTSENVTLDASYSYFQLGSEVGTNDPCSFFVWGAQLEEGAFCTSYIPTIGLSQATRAADSIPTPSAITNVINGSGATIIADVKDVPLVDGTYYIIGGNSWDKLTPLGLNTQYDLATFMGTGLTYLSSGSTSSAAFDNALKSGLRTGVAFNNPTGGFSLKSSVSYLNETSDSSVPDTAYNFGKFGAPNEYLNGYIQRVRFWNTRLSNSAFSALVGGP